MFFQFAFEAGVAGGDGVVAGLALGWGASRLIASRVELPFVFDGGNALLALSCAAPQLRLASWPAARARLDPIRALKHE